MELQKHEDERSFFARSWCQKEFEARGLNPRTVQCNVSFNKLKGTLSRHALCVHHMENSPNITALPTTSS
jgi:dTDP-4-dehydrorhamnose 3,5-epimerase-like enzyme